MSSKPTPKRCYAPQPGVVTILSDNPPRSLAMVTSWGFKRLPAAQPGEAYRCKRDDGRYAVIVDDRTTALDITAGGVE